MPIDYNSFIAGVQTAMRLGREPPRVPTPVPSGRYILTENKRKIYTEKVRAKDVTIFYPGEWVETGKTWEDDGVPPAFCVVFIDFPGNWVLNYIPQNQYDGVFFCAKYYPSIGSRYYDYFMCASLQHERNFAFLCYYDRNGNPYAYSICDLDPRDFEIMSGYLVGEMQGDIIQWVPDGTEPFYGRSVINSRAYRENTSAFLDELTQEPLITEEVVNNNA